MLKDCKNHIDINSAKHFAITFALSIIGGWYGACIAAGASVTKEWCDKNCEGHHWCWADLAFDCLGIVCGLALNLLLF